MENKWRSLVKTLSWRVVATFITAVSTWIVTENYSYAAVVGVTDSLVKLFAYYSHERIWNRIPLGRLK